MHRASAQRSWILSVNMLGVCVRTCISLLLCGAVFVEGARLVPSLEFAKSYETHVQYTAFNLSDDSKSVTQFLEEYHDLEKKVGRFDLVKGGARLPNFYFLEVNHAATIEGLKCTRRTINGLVEAYGFQDMYMHDNSTGIIGPSALLWKVNDMTPKPGEFLIRGIPCRKFIDSGWLDIFPTTTYYISSSNWTSVHGVKEEAPVRIEFSTPNVSRIIVDFTFFEVNTSDSLYSSFLIPLHIGCSDLETTHNNMFDLTTDSAKIIYYADEITDVYAEKNKAESITTLERTWIDESNHLVKFDYVNMDYLFHSSIFDFNTGVVYVSNNKGMCTIDSIYKDPLFDKKFKGSTSEMKKVSEILLLNLGYGYLGQTMHRNIHCDVFEAIKYNYTYEKDLYEKMVFTYFVMTPEYRTAANQDSQRQFMVALDMTGYNKDQKQTMQVERDFFDFRLLEHYPTSSGMNVENCFPDEGRKKYFAIYFPVNDETRQVVELNRDAFLEKVKTLIMKVAGISFLRLPYTKMYISSENVTIVGKMLDRPSLLASYRMDSVPGPNKGQEGPVNATTAEECAVECESKNNCRGFTYCEDEHGEPTPEHDCYLTRDDVKEDSPIASKKTCGNYNRAVVQTDVKEVFLEPALQNLFHNVVVDKNFTIQVTIQGKVHEIKAKQMDKDLRPFNAKKYDKYEEISMGNRLVPDSHTIYEIDESVISEAECFSKCRNDLSIACTTFSYCPSLKNCRISSLPMRNLTLAMVDDLIEANKECKVFRRKSLELFSESPGLVSSSRGDKSVARSSGGGEDECASLCLDLTDFKCEGFEVCETQCVFHKKHILDVVSTSSTPDCKHYYLNYSLSLIYMSDVVVKDVNAIVRQRMSLDECAKLCFDPEVKCRSINFCPSIPGEPSICEVNTKTMSDDGVTTLLSERCQNFEKTDQDQMPTTPWTTVSDSTDKSSTTADTGSTDESPPTPVSDSPDKSSLTPVSGSTDGTAETTVETKERHVVRRGVEPGAFSGAVIGMLIFGILVGAIGFLGYSYYRSRRAGDGISVRFTKETL